MNQARNNTRTVDLTYQSKVQTMKRDGTSSEVVPGEDGRWYVLAGAAWLWSFPSEAAAWQWLTSPVDADLNLDSDADERRFEALGGEHPA